MHASKVEPAHRNSAGSHCKPNPAEEFQWDKKHNSSEQLLGNSKEGTTESHRIHEQKI